jgi:molybdenum cofactor cytidylyltransferase
MASPRAFAVIPAAGHSVRMGRPKLLLPYRDACIIDHVLSVWVDCVERVVVVVRSDDDVLAERCAAHDVDITRPISTPPDMKASVMIGLQHIQASYGPSETDCWLLAPADTPRISARDIKAVIGGYDPAAPTPVLAAYDGRRGHPLLAPWSLVGQIEHLRSDQGIRSLIESATYTQVDCSQPGVLEDLDTPSDYNRLREEP